MPSFQDQLTEIEDKELSHQVVFKRIRKLNSALENVEWISGLLSFTIIVGFFVILYTYIIPNPNEGFAIFFTFYGGIFLVVLLKTSIVNPLKSFTHFLYNISPKEYKLITEIQTGFQDKKYEIQKQIKDDKKKVFRERERKLAEQLDSLVGLAEKKKFPLEKVEEIKNKLAAEHVEIRNFGYQIHTNVYYTNRFTKINQALSAPKVDPDHIPTKISESLTNPTQTQNIVIKSTEEKSAITNTNIENFNPPPVEPKSYIAGEKPEEKSKTLEILEPTEEKKIPFAESKQTSEVKIVPKSATTITNKEKPIPKEEERTSSELFGTTSVEGVRQESVKTYQPKPSVKIDFAKLNEHRHTIGELGELYSFAKEQNHLISQGKINQSKEIIHVSLSSDSEGYDIISFTDTGERKYIEVKTTTGNEFEPFYLSNSEVEAINRLNNYWIYRVYNFNIDLKKGDIYKIDCKKDLGNYYNIQPSSFKVTPKG